MGPHGPPLGPPDFSTSPAGGSVLEQPGEPKRAHKRWGTLQRAFGHFRGERPPRWGRQSELVFPFNILNTPVATSFVVDASLSILNRNFQLELPFRPTKTTTDKRQSRPHGPRGRARQRPPKTTTYRVPQSPESPGLPPPPGGPDSCDRPWYGRLENVTSRHVIPKGGASRSWRRPFQKLDQQLDMFWVGQMLFAPRARLIDALTHEPLEATPTSSGHRLPNDTHRKGPK